MRKETGSHVVFIGSRNCVYHAFPEDATRRPPWFILVSPITTSGLAERASGCRRLGLTVREAIPAVSLDSYLVDPASSHMLVSKIKPCMSKYKRIHTVKLRMAH